MSKEPIVAVEDKEISSSITIEIAYEILIIWGHHPIWHTTIKALHQLKGCTIRSENRKVRQRPVSAIKDEEVNFSISIEISNSKGIVWLQPPVWQSRVIALDK